MIPTVSLEFSNVEELNKFVSVFEKEESFNCQGGQVDESNTVVLFFKDTPARSLFLSWLKSKQFTCKVYQGTAGKLEAV